MSLPSVGPSPSAFHCAICDYQTATPDPHDLGMVRGNTEKYQAQYFRLWHCPECRTVQSIDPMDHQEMYEGYPLNQRQEDLFARATLRNLLKRLRRAGLREGERILDYGCGNGIFVKFLQRNGFTHVSGYDPWVEEFSILPTEDTVFDCIIVNDVIEHCEDVRALISACRQRLRPGGLLYVGTVESDGLTFENLAPQTMKLHQPFHRIFLPEAVLHRLCQEQGFEIQQTYKRSYLDTLMPFANYRFLDELSKALHHNMDKMLQPAEVGKVFWKRPQLVWFGLFGYWFPSAFEPAVVLRKNT